MGRISRSIIGIDPRVARLELRFLADHAEEIAKAKPVMPESLNDREADCWEPLIVIAEAVRRNSPAGRRG